MASLSVDFLLERCGVHVARFDDARGVPQPRLGEGSWGQVSAQPDPDANTAWLGGASPAAELAAYRRALGDRGGMIFGRVDDAAFAAAMADGGLTRAGDVPVMVAALTVDASAHDAAVATVDADTLPAALGVMAAAFGVAQVAVDERLVDRDGIDAWTLREDGTARSALVAAYDTTLVGVFAMATPPDQERRGHGRRLLRHVLADAAARGVTHAYLMATPAGLPLYERLGFETVGTVDVWTLGASTQFPSVVASRARHNSA